MLLPSKEELRLDLVEPILLVDETDHRTREINKRRPYHLKKYRYQIYHVDYPTEKNFRKLFRGNFQT